MFSGCLTRPFLHRTAGVVLSLLILQLWWPAPAPGQRSPRPGTCFFSGLPGEYLSEVSLRLEIDSEDLLVTVPWPEEPGSADLTFVLSAPVAGEIGGWPAEQVPGEETEQRLAGALTQVAAAGFQYLLELRDAGEVVGRRPFRVAVNCAGEPCEYQLLAGLEGGPIAVSEAFWEALAEARAGGSPDLLASVRDQHPELAAEVPGFAWQYQQVESRPGTDCSCRWLVVQRLTPGTVIGPWAGPLPSHQAGISHPGAGFVAGVQTISGRADVERNQTEGSTVLGLQLLCTSDRGGTPEQYPTLWSSLPMLEIRKPALSSCRAPCTPLIDHLAYVGGCAAGTATSREQQRAWSRAEMDAGASLNGQATIAGAALIDLDFSNNQSFNTQDSFLRDSAATVTGEQAVVELHAGALIKAEVTSPDNDNFSYAFAAASMEYALELEAPEICGIPQGGALLVNALPKDKDGGVAMERWELP